MQRLKKCRLTVCRAVVVDTAFPDSNTSSGLKNMRMAFSFTHHLSISFLCFSAHFFYHGKIQRCWHMRKEPVLTKILPFPNYTKSGINKFLNKDGQWFCLGVPDRCHVVGLEPCHGLRSCWVPGSPGTLLLHWACPQALAALLWPLLSAHDEAGLSGELPTSSWPTPGAGSRVSECISQCRRQKLTSLCQMRHSKTSACSSPRVNLLPPKNISHQSWGSCVHCLS